MPTFARLPDVLSDSERALAEAAFSGRHKDAPKWGNLVLDAYDALLVRVRLAELALYRLRVERQNIDLLIAQANAKGRTMRPEEVAQFVASLDEHYVDPILPALREAVEYPGSVEGPWYPEAESLRAKLVGQKRAEERLRGERT